MARIEQVVDLQIIKAPAGGSRQAPGGARGYQIRIPDPKQWNLTILKNGETGFLPWRKSFELQVRAIWAGLDVVLERSERKLSQSAERSTTGLLARTSHSQQVQWIGITHTHLKQVVQHLVCTLACRSDQDRRGVIPEVWVRGVSLAESSVRPLHARDRGRTAE